MRISIGTFNLNNLFSRYNFHATIDALREAEPDEHDVAVAYTFDQNSGFMARTFKGRLVHGKRSTETQAIADRIVAMGVDVLAVQEVEDIAVLHQFDSEYLNGLYPFLALIEGNDERLIDVGVMSKLPIGKITSFQTAVHPDQPDRRVFGRDLLAVEILDPARKRKLFTLYNTHLKSHFVDFRDDPVAGAAANNLRRQRQAESVARLIAENERKGARFVLTGDMNDPVDSAFLQSMFTVEGIALVNPLTAPLETRPPKAETQGPGPLTTAWSYRFNPPGADTPPEYSLYDQIWLSPALAGHVESTHVDRRTKHGGDGSDHDPTWVVLSL